MVIEERERATTPKPPEGAPAAATREVSLPVKGMTCASCVRRVERAIGKVPGVQSVAVNLATERATIDYYPGAASVADLRAAVEKAGYGIGQEATAADD